MPYNFVYTEQIKGTQQQQQQQLQQKRIFCIEQQQQKAFKFQQLCV